MKELLSHILTKKDLTIYLAEHCVDVLSKVGKQFVVVFNTKCITNIPQYPEELLQHNQEEADTLILLQAKMSLIWIPLLIYMLFHQTRTFFYS